MVKYSVAICNYNMVDTIDIMLESILDQTDDRFEVVVVDGGSSDGSQKILKDLSEKYKRLRVDLQEPDPDRHLGADRNRSFELAKGDYILESFDCDNRYYNIIEDLTKIYHEIESNVDTPFLLSAMGVNMAPRDLVLQIPYRNLGGAEDRDWFRRLTAKDAVVYLQRCGDIKEQIGYEKGVRSQIHRDIGGKICDFRTGITLKSALKWSLYHERYFIYEKDRGQILNTAKKPYDFFSHIYSYLKALPCKRYEAPDGFEKKGTLERYIAEERATLPEIANLYNIDFDPKILDETAKSAFWPNEKL